jgi:putative CRISPR-associated protein (TIGR02620 family)
MLTIPLREGRAGCSLKLVPRISAGRSAVDLPAECGYIHRLERSFMDKIVVTRHQGLIPVLIEHGIVEHGVPVVAHATAADVAGRHVVGVLPLHLAALTAKVTEVTWAIPANLRGVELDAAQVKTFMTGVSTYKVEKLS